nr:uncharacterized protein LOC111513909 [Leptinotarsa decemlineata]
MWLTFKMDLNELSEIQIPRHVISPSNKGIELHGFSDASQTAYAACIYVRSSDRSERFRCRLLYSKTRVAPLKTLTIPRLELCAALLLAELMNKVKLAIISTSVKIENINFWSDSSITLSWIRGPPNTWKVFVANRVARIQELSNPSNWKNVNTRDNPADLPSRGTSATTLINSKLWWSGPEWLASFRDEWPKNLHFTIPTTEMPEIRSTTLISITSKTHDFSKFPELNKFSTLNKLKRVFAYIIRFVDNVKVENFRKTGPLSPEELNNSIKKLTRLAQSEIFAVEINQLTSFGHVNNKSPLLNLNPFLDECGIIRVGGRLKHSNFDLNKKHPAVLPKSHRLTVLIARDEHVKRLHAGPQALLVSLRDCFWPISGRCLVRKVVHECMKCHRFRANNIKNIMGDLPKDRLTPARPFTVTGVDYCSPFPIRDRKI